jgi:hypothetical protein
LSRRRHQGQSDFLRGISGLLPDRAIGLQHGLGNKDDKGVANDKGVVKFRKVEIRPL